MLPDIGRLIEYYRKKELQSGDNNFYKKNFIIDDKNSSICAIDTYNTLAKGKIVKRIDIYEKLTINLQKNFKLNSDLEGDHYYDILNNLCKSFEIHIVEDINKHFSYLKSLLKNYHYIGYETISIYFIY